MKTSIHPSLRRLFALALAAVLSLTLFAPSAAIRSAARSENMKIGQIDIGYAPGDVYPDTKESMELTGTVQCAAFARYCQQVVYGCNDYNAPDKFHDIVGKKSPSECTAANMKKWFMGCAPATHLRCPGGTKSMHSMAIAETTDSYVHVIHGNWYPGNVVDETFWSWEQFADQANARGGIVFAMSYSGTIPARALASKDTTDETTLPDVPTGFVMGDINFDGKVTTKDARLALRCAAKLYQVNDSQLLRADVDKNGKVTGTDARRILRAAAKLETLR